MSISRDDDGNYILDFDSVILPEGEYHVHISAVKPGMKKNATASDYPYFEFHYFVESRVDGEEMSPELVGSDVMDICSMSPQAAWKLKPVLEAFTCREWAEKKMTVNTDELVGLSAIAVIVHDSYNGVQRAKAAKVYNPDYVPPEKPADVPTEDAWESFNDPDQ